MRFGVFKILIMSMGMSAIFACSPGSGGLLGGFQNPAGSYSPDPGTTGTGSGTTYNPGTGAIEGGTGTPEDTGSIIDLSGNLALLHLDEDSGSSFTDASSNGNDFSCASCPSLNVSGKVGDAIDFTTSGQFLEDSDAENYLNGLSAISITFWIKSDIRDVDRGIVSGKTPDGVDSVLSIRYDKDGPSSSKNLIAASLNVSGSTLNYYSSSFTQTTDWQHIALTWSSGNQIELYINGDKDIPIQNSAGIAGSLSDLTTLILGKGALDTANSWDGKLDEFAIFDRVLSDAEVRAIYSSQNSKYSSYYDSAVIDAGSSADWSSLSWTPTAPFAKHLPPSAGVESTYGNGNIDMTGNVLLLRLEESDGATTFTDVSGLGNSGTCTGAECPRAGMIGKIGNGARFDGSNTVVRIPDSTSLRVTGDLTLSAWVEWRDGDPGFGSSDFSYILEKGQNDNDNYGFLFYNGRLLFEFEDTGGAYRYWQSPAGIVAADGWHHWAVVYDAGNDKVYFYKDGVEIYNASTTYEIAGDQSNDLLIGMQNYGSNTMRMAGMMDEIGIWARPLSPAEIFSLYRRGINRLKIQVRSCDDPACSGETFLGEGGSPYTYYTELLNTSLGLPSGIPLSGIISNRYVQYRVYLESDHASYLPSFTSVTIDAD